MQSVSSLSSPIFVLIASAMGSIIAWQLGGVAGGTTSMLDIDGSAPAALAAK